MENIISDYLTVISFLIGTGAFVLGLYVPHATTIAGGTGTYYKILILALVIPAILLTIHGIIMTYSSDPIYIGVFLILFVPPVAIISILLKKSLA